MKSEFLAPLSVMRGSVVITGLAAGPLELPRLYARWVDAGGGTIQLRGCHALGENCLTAHGIAFGDSFGSGDRIELGEGALTLRLGAVEVLAIAEGSMDILETDGWTFVRFSSKVIFKGKEKPVEMNLDGWYSDLSY